MKRRDFFKLTAIASGTAISACNNKIDEKILPYLVPPDDGIIPGVSSYMRSTCTGCAANCGIEVKISDGKAVKLEGNPVHPISRGGLCIRGQASLSKLYHPERLRTPLLRNSEGNYEKTDWDTAGKLIKKKLDISGENNLKNLLISSRLSGSIKKLTSEFCSEMKFRNLGGVEAINYLPVSKGNDIIFNKHVVPQYKIEESDLLITLGADILDTFLSPVEFAKKLREARDADLKNWIHIGEIPTLTGYTADLTIPVKNTSTHHLLGNLLRRTIKKTRIPENILGSIPDIPTGEVAEKTGISEEILEDLVNSLKLSKKPLLISGGVSISGENGVLVAALTSLLQWGLGSVNETLDFDNGYDLGSLADQKSINGQIDELPESDLGVTLFLNIPTWTFEKNISKKLSAADFKIALSEFSPAAEGNFDLILPMSDNLESWGDTFPKYGVRSLIQPGIEPLYETKSPGDLLLWIMGRDISWQNYLIKEWGGNSEKWIENGFREEYREPVRTGLNNSKKIETSLKNLFAGDPGQVNGNSLIFVPSIRGYDGRDHMIDLLQEVPDPLTSVSYGDHILVSKSSGADMSIKEGDVVRIKGDNVSGEFPVIFSPDLDKNILILPLGTLKNTAELIVDKNGGLNTVFTDISIEKTGKKKRIPRLSGSFDTEGRDVLPFLNEKKGHHKIEKLHSLYPEHEHVDYRWAMVIDLDACNGCSSCVASCYIENNIPMTGSEEHLKGREMSWLRIEPYMNSGGEAEFLPMMCQQCDSAPCETVCPVFATYHNQEGLNAQIYNRCVGTRYCANNCPYKTRRFNWFDNEKKLPLYDVSNPDLSVRPKGVMEKCTFCVQRIRSAKDSAKDQGRLVEDGEIRPACAQSCPSDAITFGNLMDKDSKVSILVRERKVYRVHENLGTRPAVYYIRGKKGKVLDHFEKKLEKNKK